MAVASLVLVGLLLVAVGLFVAGSIELIALGVVSLIAAAVLETMTRRVASR